MSQVKENIILIWSATAALTDLVCHCSCNHVSWSKVFNGRCVALHEPFAGGVSENSAFTSGCLGQEDSQTGKAGRVELVKLHVLQRDASSKSNRHSVTGQGVSIRSGFVDLAKPTGCKNNRLCLENVNVSGGEFIGNNSGWLAIVHYQIQNVELIEKIDSELDAVLVQSLQNHVASSVGCVTAAPNRCLAVVPRVTSEAALVNLAVWGSVKGQSHVL